MPKARSPMKIGIIAAVIALVVTLLATGVATVLFLPDSADPEKFGEASGQLAFFVALASGVIAYTIARRRRRT